MPESNVSSAFAATPSNPNLPSPAPENSPMPPAGDAPAGGVPQPAGDDVDLNALLASLGGGSSSPSPADQHGADPQPAPQPAPSPAAEPVQPDWQSMAQQQQQFLQIQQRNDQLTQQNAELMQKLQEQDTAINNLMESQKDYANLKAQNNADNIDFGELATIDVDDAKRISSGILKAISAELAPIRAALQQQQQYAQQSVQWQEQQFIKQKAQDTVQKILAKHPDFVALQSDPAYLKFVRQRDGKSSQTRDARAAFEFQNGNVDYIVDLLNQFKQQQPQSNSIASVAPVQTATNPSAPAGPAVQLPTLNQLNSWMQMRQITPDQYRQILAKIRAAQKQQG